MRAVDTNVLARALVRDPSSLAQCELASAWLVAQREVFVPQVVEVELVWLLSRGFGLHSAEVVAVLRALGGHPAIRLQAADAFEAGSNHLAHGGDFADGIVAFESARVGATLATFDRRLAELEGAALVDQAP